MMEPDTFPDRRRQLPSPDEPLAHFLVGKSKFNRPTDTVNAVAFLPRREKKTGRLALSMLRTRRLSEQEILAVARKHLLPLVKRLFGRADLIAADIPRDTLRLDPDDKPYEGHVNVLGWPDNEEDQLELAGEIALKAKLNLLPQSIRGGAG